MLLSSFFCFHLEKAVFWLFLQYTSSLQERSTLLDALRGEKHVSIFLKYHFTKMVIFSCNLKINPKILEKINIFFIFIPVQCRFIVSMHSNTNKQQCVPECVQTITSCLFAATCNYNIACMLLLIFCDLSHSSDRVQYHSNSDTPYRNCLLCLPKRILTIGCIYILQSLKNGS